MGYLLTLDLQPDDTHIAAGMSDGTLSVRRRQAKASEPSSNPIIDSIRTGTFETLLGGNPFQFIGKPLTKEKGKAKVVPVGDAGELKIEARRRKKLRAYDRLLKNFKYSAALDTVLRKVSEASLLCSPCSVCCQLNDISDVNPDRALGCAAGTTDDSLLAHPGTCAP